MLIALLFSATAWAQSPGEVTAHALADACALGPSATMADVSAYEANFAPGSETLMRNLLLSQLFGGCDATWEMVGQAEGEFDAKVTWEKTHLKRTHQVHFTLTQSKDSGWRITQTKAASQKKDDGEKDGSRDEAKR